jgi:hypothetical protein
LLTERIEVERATSWDDAKKKLLEFEGTMWMFRGQRDSTWALETSLERVVATRNGPAVENYMLQEFKRRAFHYLTAERIPNDEHKMEWLALLQHHGAPTRLLDWTRSPYVAAFFALEATDPGDKDNHCAIWVINATWLQNISLDRLKSLGRSFGAAKTPEFWKPDYLNAVLNEPVEGVYPVRPFRMNERLAIQQGLFIASGDPSKGFESHLESYLTTPKTNRIWKVEIPKRDRLDALQDLRWMNISKTTLYPGIDGFVQSLVTDAAIDILPRKPAKRTRSKPKQPAV